MDTSLKREKGNIIIIVAIIVAVLIIGIALWFWFGHSGSSTTTNNPLNSGVSKFPPTMAPTYFPPNFQLNGVLSYLASSNTTISSGTIETSRSFYSSIAPKAEYKFYQSYLKANQWQLITVDASSTALYRLVGVKASSSVVIEIPTSQTGGKTVVSIGFFYPR